MYLRRIALCLAAVSFSVLMFVILLYNITLQTQASPCARNYHSIQVENTPLQILAVVEYEGAFAEDYSEDMVFSVSAILLHNPSGDFIAEAVIVIHSTKGSFLYRAEMIPAGHTVLIPERGRAPYEEMDILEVYGWVYTSDAFLSGLEITEIEADEIMVSNDSGKTLENVRIYYKSYLPQEGIYLGGIAREVFIPSLSPGESVTLELPFYAPEYSRIVYTEYH